MNNINNKKIPESTISRLFAYLREIAELAKVNIRTISSSELGERLNLSDTQVRKDLGYFGNFGVSGAGYDVSELKKALEKILGKDKTWNVAIVGVGHLGSALLAYSGFKKSRLEIVAAFDKDIKKIGKSMNGVTVQAVEELTSTAAEKNISIGIIAVGAQEAQGVAGQLIKARIKCIMNFAPVSLNVPDNAKVKDVDLCRELETLSYFLADKK